MPIEFICEGCTNHLRVPDKYAGKQAKCPSCNHINAIPIADVAVPPVRSDSQSDPVSVQQEAENPYSPSSAPSGRVPLSSNSVAFPFKPLYESVFYIKFAAWYFILSGAFACLTIVGIIYGWLPIWVGICLKNAARDIETGYPNNDTGMLLNASSNLATVAKIFGVLIMIGVSLLAIYLVLLIFAVIIGVAGSF